MERKKIKMGYSAIAFIGGIFVDLVVAAANGTLGVLHRSAWQGSLCAYYLALMLMKLYLLYTGMIGSARYERGRYRKLLNTYFVCSVVIILLDAVLGGIVYLMAAEHESKHYPGVLVYGVAFYAFCKVALAIVNFIKARRLRAPLLMSIRSIGYVDALVSILMLETSLIETFGNRSSSWTTRMIASSGAGAWFLVLWVGIRGVLWCRKRRRVLRKNLNEQKMKNRQRAGNAGSAIEKTVFGDGGKSAAGQ